MSDIPVTLSEANPTVDVETGSAAQLNLPAGAVPTSWSKVGNPAWAAPGAAPFTVPPTPGRDETYTATDGTTTWGAVVRWKPDAPNTVKVEGGKGSLTVEWNPPLSNENEVTYYEVDLVPRPEGISLPRKVKRAAVQKVGTKRRLKFDGVRPEFYTAKVKAVRSSPTGAVASAEAPPPSPTEVLPGIGRRTGKARVLTVAIAVAALAATFVRALDNPLADDKVGLDKWALWTGLFFVTFLVFGLLSIVSVSSLLAGSDNRISTSRVNVAIWTVAIAFGITTLAAVAFGSSQYHHVNPCDLSSEKAATLKAEAIADGRTDEYHPKKIDGVCVSGRPRPKNELDFNSMFKDGLSPQYLALLGTPFLALAMGSFIVNRQVDNEQRQKVEGAGPASPIDALTNDNGTADLVDSQYLIFTGVLLFYFVTTFLPNPTALPDLPWGLVGLTGVSAGTYLLNKGVATNGLSVQGLEASAVPAGSTSRILGLNFLPEGSAGLANGGVAVKLNGSDAPITNVTNNAVSFTAPVAGTYSVVVTTAANVSAAAGTLVTT